MISLQHQAGLKASRMRQVIIDTTPISYSDDDSDNSDTSMANTAQSSLSHIEAQCRCLLLADEAALVRSTRLVVTGTWSVSDKSGSEEEAWEREMWEREQAVKCIRRIMERMMGIRSFIWTTTLPFPKALWHDLSPFLHELHLSLAIPRSRHEPGYFAQEDLKPLCDFEELRVLRLSGMKESYQSVVWEAVWRNHALHTLELHMALEPIVRQKVGRGEQEQKSKWKRIDGGWEWAGESLGEMEEARYRGQKGKGMLDYTFGYGEYLDVVSIRQGRLAACVSDDSAWLPLQHLWLEGFVVDGTPFAGLEFSNLRSITFGRWCWDAGFQLPQRLSGQVDVLVVVVDGGGGGHGAGRGRRDTFATGDERGGAEVMESCAGGVGPCARPPVPRKESGGSLRRNDSVTESAGGRW